MVFVEHFSNQYIYGLGWLCGRPGNEATKTLTVLNQCLPQGRKWDFNFPTYSVCNCLLTYENLGLEVSTNQEKVALPLTSGKGYDVITII